MAQTQRRVFPDGDYPQRLNDLWAALDAAIKDEARGNVVELLQGELSPVEELTEEYRALRAEAEADAEAKRRVVVLRAVGRREWRPLKVKHPPRSDAETAKGDRLAGVNTDTVGEDLIHASVIGPDSMACAHDQREEGEACSPGNLCANRRAYSEWLDDFSEGEFQTLLQDAWRLVNVAQFDPKSLPASQSQRSDTN